MLTSKEIASLCAAGATAPSGANEQPWRVTVRGHVLEIGLDPDRAGAGFLDIGGYASRFALGCFAENVGIAARAHGLTYERTTSDEGVLFSFTGRHGTSGDDLYEYLPRRVTNRRLFDGTELAAADVRRLAEAAAPCTVTAASTADGKRAAAAVLGAADALRMRHPAMFADMVREICWSQPEALARRDGLDLRTLELPGSTRVLLALLRRFPRVRMVLPSARLGDTARSLVLGCSHICCLSLDAPATAGSMVDAGAGMQRLWLEATRAGIAVHPWTVSTFEVLRLEAFGGEGFSAPERDTVRDIARGLRAVFQLAPGQTPVFVFRLSKAPPPTARSLRRPWQSFTTVIEPPAGSHS